MKEITITPKRQKTELWILLTAFVIANLCNLGAIIHYDAPATEMLTSFFYVLTFTVFLYVLTVLARITYHGIIKLSQKTRHYRP